MASATGSQDERPGLLPAVTTIAASGYGAYIEGDCLFIRDFSSSDREPELVLHDPGLGRSCTAVAFSSARTNLLAIALGSRICVFDVQSRSIKQVLPGNGRAVTTIAFHDENPDLLAVGTLDGAFYICSANEALTPVFQAVGGAHACDNLAFHPIREDIVAANHGDRVTLWSRHNARCIYATQLDNDNVVCLEWLWDSACHLLVVCADGSSTVIRFDDLPIAADHHVKEATDLFTLVSTALAEDASIQARPTKLSLDIGIRQIQKIGTCGVLVLPESGKSLSILTYDPQECSLTKLWNLLFEAPVSRFILRADEVSAEVQAYGAGDVGIHELPMAIYEAIRRQTKTPDAVQSAEETTRDGDLPYLPRGNMNPEPLRCTSDIGNRSTAYHFFRTRRPSIHRHSRGKRSRFRSAFAFDTTPIQSMTSSLELPKDPPDDNASPIPFLSPGLPERHPMGQLITPIDESIHFAPLARGSFDSMHSSAAQDSDSDDEAFPGGPGTCLALPSSENVPLPRTCGAVFGPSGRLAIFLPSKPKPITAAEGSDSGEIESAEKEAPQLARIFPAFGNLKTIHQPGVFPAAEHDELFADPSYRARSAFISSMESRFSWQLKLSPTKPGVSVALLNSRINVKVLNIGGASTLHQKLASRYRFIQRPGEHLSDICTENASYAAAAGSQQTALLWRSLGLLLESSLPPGMALHGKDVASKLQSQSAHEHIMHRASSQSQPYSTSLWLSHPFGRNWAIRLILEWAERHADVQLLANICALLLQQKTAAEESTTGATLSRSLSGSFPGFSIDLSSPVSSAAQRLSAIPPLASPLVDHSMSERSLSKPVSSRASSRHPSLPTTPYLGSSASTPPLSFTMSARQTPKMSNSGPTSGAGSPDHHRSSFSAAARSYAQSITDRFAAYGSSPPLKKQGTSPHNELSSSLPTSSWKDKTVSFASTVSTSKNSRRSSTLALEDSKHDNEVAVEEVASPLPERKGDLDVSITLKNHGAFYDESSAGPMESIMSDDIESRSGLWCRTYAENLRAWNHPIEAAEMDKLSRWGEATISKGRAVQEVLPQTAVGRSQPLCCICSTVMRAAEQICPACLHAAHPSCFVSVISAMDQADFLCPTGCGCHCAAASDELFNTSDVPTADAVPRKVRPEFTQRPSFHAPRRLREVRVMGEPW